MRQGVPWMIVVVFIWLVFATNRIPDRTPSMFPLPRVDCHVMAKVRGAQASSLWQVQNSPHLIIASFTLWAFQSVTWVMGGRHYGLLYKEEVRLLSVAWRDTELQASLLLQVLMRGQYLCKWPKCTMTKMTILTLAVDTSSKRRGQTGERRSSLYRCVMVFMAKMGVHGRSKTWIWGGDSYY